MHADLLEGSKFKFTCQQDVVRYLQSFFKCKPSVVSKSLWLKKKVEGKSSVARDLKVDDEFEKLKKELGIVPNFSFRHANK